MSRYVICEGVTFNGSDESIVFIKTLVEGPKKDEMIRMSNEEWISDMIRTGKYKDSDIFSDIYKDTYGFRPRWLYD